MSNKVGTKGQVVIPKGIRDRLGIGPGWRAVYHVVDEHLEVHFVPPEHNRSLRGILAPYVRERLGTSEEDWAAARDRAWDEAVRERVRQWTEDDDRIR